MLFFSRSTKYTAYLRYLRNELKKLPCSTLSNKVPFSERQFSKMRKGERMR